MYNRYEEASNCLKEADRSVESLLSSVYTWLLVPGATKEDAGDVVLRLKHLQSEGTGSAGIIRAAAHALEHDEDVVSSWAPRFLLKGLDNSLWNGRDEMPIRELWDYFCKYLYMQKLSDENVLLRTIQQGVATKAGFSYAEDVLEGRYFGLERSTENVQIQESGYIVRDSAALRQIVDDEKTRQQPPEPPVPGGGSSPAGPDPVSEPAYTHFSVAAVLNEEKLQQQIALLNDEIISIVTFSALKCRAWSNPCSAIQ